MKPTGESAADTCEGNVLVDQGKHCVALQLSEMSTVAGVKSTFDSVSENAVGKALPRISDASISDDNVLHSNTEGRKVLEGHDDFSSCVGGTDEYANKISDIEDVKINYGGKSEIGGEISDKVPSSSSSIGLSSLVSVSVEIAPSESTDDASKLQYTFSHASNRKHMSHNPNLGDVEDDKPSDTKDELVDSAKLLNSLPSTKLASDVACGDPPAPDLNPIEKKNMEIEIQPNDETDYSDMVEEDVKVCDICGDAGREESLAVCCRCSDGAEHTYCMREMLDKVPEGDWMCEECKSLERVTVEGPEKIGRVDKNENNKFSGQASSDYVNSSDIEGHKTKSSMKTSGKRLRDDADAGVSPIVNKPSREPIVGSAATSNSSNSTALSCENSSKHTERCSLRSSHGCSIDTSPVNDNAESAQTVSNVQVQQFQGTFLKFNSFNSLNSKPKVKPVDQVVLRRQMSAREHASRRLKEGFGRSIGKSVSLKSTTSSHSETKMKTLPPRLSYTQDTKSTKQQSSFECQSSSEMDHPPARSSAAFSSSLGKLGVSSTDGAHETRLKDSSCSVVVEKLPINEGLRDGLSRSGDFANSCEQMREFSGSHFPSSVKSSRDEGSILRAALEAALLRKPGLCRKQRALGQPNNSSVSVEGLSSGGGDAVPIAPLDGKSSSRDTVLNVPPAMHSFLKSFAIPHHEYIWQGSFEICRSGKIFGSWDGIQAHLSTCSSPKVIEAANKFKSRIVLYEVPRLSTWPIQFQEHGVRDDNVALFFFARDVESYDKIYKLLLDNMMKNDLALKGDFNGVELLIFPSNQLPDNSQRWNMLFFLWGVFRGKKESCMQHMPESVQQYSAPRYLPPATVSLPESKCSLKPIGNDLTASEHAAPAPTVLAAKELCNLLTSRAVNGDSITEMSSLDQPNSGPNPYSSVAVRSDSANQCQEVKATCLEGGINFSFSTPPQDPSSNESSGREQMLMDLDTPPDRKQSTHQCNDFVSDSHDVEGSDRTILDRRTCKDLEKSNMDAEDLSTNGETPFLIDRDTKNSNMEHDRCLLNSKEPLHPVLPQTLSLGASAVLREYDGDTRDEPSGPLEKLPRDDGDIRYEPSGTLEKMSHVAATSPCILDNRQHKAHDKTGIPVNKENAESHLFPTETQPVTGIPWRVHPLGQNRFHDTAPNLDLALGAEMKPLTQGNSPLLVEEVDKKTNEEHVIREAGTNAEDDASASLSLSLSFPFQ